MIALVILPAIKALFMFFWGLKTPAPFFVLRVYYCNLYVFDVANVVNFAGVDILNVSAVYFTSRATAELKLKQKGQTGMNTKEAKAAGEGRRERWLKLAEVQLAEIRDNPFYVQREVFEEIEGRNLAEVITDHLCTFRGVGVVNAGPEAKYKFEADEWYERQSSRKRGAHDLEIVRRAVFDFLMPGVYVGMFDQKEIRAFTRKFYRIGDIGLREAKDRALRYALEH